MVILYYLDFFVDYKKIESKFKNHIIILENQV